MMLRFLAIVATTTTLLLFSSAQEILAVDPWAQSSTKSPGLNCRDGCKPWMNKACSADNGVMKTRLVLDVTSENQAKLNGTQDIGNGTKTSQWQVSWGFCAKVDQLQAFQMTDSARWVVGNFADKKVFTSDNQTKYLRLYGGVGLATVGLIPPNNFDSSVVISQPSAENACNGGKGVKVATFLVLNFTMTNGLYRMVSSFDQSVQVGFKPTCDETGCMVDSSMGCLGPKGRQNCATCIKDAADLDNHPITVFAAYYGSDGAGRRMQSGSGNPLNFRAMAQTSVFSAVKDGLTGAVDKSKDFAENNVP